MTVHGHRCQILQFCPRRDETLRRFDGHVIDFDQAYKARAKRKAGVWWQTACDWLKYQRTDAARWDGPDDAA